jgi:hypothetical protein
MNDSKEFKPAWTPGPWTCDEDGVVWGVDSRGWYGKCPSIDIFAASEWPAELADEAMANARLIAAAPDLHEALAGLMNSLNMEHAGRPVYDAYQKCAAAIAKARGKG